MADSWLDSLPDVPPPTGGGDQAGNVTAFPTKELATSAWKANNLDTTNFDLKPVNGGFGFVPKGTGAGGSAASGEGNWFDNLPDAPSDVSDKTPAKDAPSAMAIAGAGLNQGLANTAGVPVDALTWGINKAAGFFGMNPIENPVGGSDWFKSVLPNDVTPTEASGQMLHRTMQDIGGAVVPFGAVGSLAKAGIGVGKPIIGSMINAFNDAPALSAGREALGSTFSGGGAAGAQQGFPNSPAAEGLGSLGGVGVLGALGLATAGVKSAYSGIRSLFPSSVAINAAVGNILRAHSIEPDTLLGRLQAARSQPAPVAGLPQTTDQILNDPGISTLARTTFRDENVAPAALALRTQQNQVIRDELKKVFPLIPDTQLAPLEKRVQAQLQALGPGASPEQVGHTIRAELIKARKGLVEGRTTMSGDLYAQADEDAAAGAASGHTIDALPALKPVLSELSAAKNPGLAKDLETVATTFKSKLTGELDDTIPGLINTSKALGQVAADQTVHPYVRGIAKDAQRQLDDILSQHVPTYRQARNMFAQGSGLINEIDDSPVGKVLAKDARSGRFDTPESAVVDQFLRAGKGGAEAARDLIKTVGSRRAAITAIEDYIAGQIRDPRNKIYDPASGRISSKALNDFLDRYKEALDQFPGVRDKLRNVGNAQAAVDRLVAKQKLRGDFFASIDAAGLDMAGDPMILAKKFRQFLRGRENEISDLMPGQFARLKRLSDAAFVPERTEAARVGKGSDTNQLTRGSTALGSLIAAAAKKVIAPVLGGATGMVFGGGVGAAVGTAAGSGVAQLTAKQQVAIIKLLGKALLDPEVAETLLTQVTPKNLPQIQTRLRGYLLDLPVGYAHAGDQRH